MNDIIKDFHASNHRCICTPRQKEFYTSITSDRDMNEDEELTVNHLKDALSKHMSNCMLKDHQLRSLESNFTFEEINQLLTINIRSMSEITYDKYRLLCYKKPELDFDLLLKRPALRRVNIFYTCPMYEVGRQKNNNMAYIKFFDVMVLDIDTQDFSSVQKRVKEMEESLQTYFRFWVYKTYNGYHLFLVSKPVNYNSEEYLTIAQFMNADKWHMLFSHFNGYCVRLSLKQGRPDEKCTHKYMNKIGNGVEIPECVELVKLFERCIGFTDEKMNEFVELQSSSSKQSFFNEFVHSIINVDVSFNQVMFDVNFRDYLKQYDTYEYMILFKEYYQLSLQRSQRLLIDNINFYIAVDMCTNVHYLCYRNFLMVDIDFPDRKFDQETLDRCIERCTTMNQEKKLSFAIYTSSTGIHVFLTNRTVDHKSKRCFEFLSEFGCDYYYKVFVYLRGFSVRLSSKDESDNHLYTFHTKIGTIGKTAQSYLRIYDNGLTQFSQVLHYKR